MTILPRLRPVLDPDFAPAALWNSGYRQLCINSSRSREIAIALEQPGRARSVVRTRILEPGDRDSLTHKYVERLVKFLLWQRGGSRLLVGGCGEIAGFLRQTYSPAGARAFDANFLGSKIYLAPFSVESVSLEEVGEENLTTVSLGRNLEGCRIGFDLGGSDRKVAALIDGEVVFSEEVPWDPYFQTDPNYHLEGVRASLRSAAEHLPRVDAIGGSAAGCYVNNEVRAASLFRGVSEEDFSNHVRQMFWKLKEEWGGVPFEVINDGEVTALAGSMSLGDNAVLGISMGTSLAAGYVDASGRVTPWLNELAFAPVDYRDDAPADEWSGDVGCGVQYFSQQAIARLAARGGIELRKEMPLADRLVEVQKLMADGDERVARVYETVGTCFGYSVAHYAEFLELRHVLILGRVTSGSGGEIILRKAREVLRSEFPSLASRIQLSTPDEKMKRHGQAVAAASLPMLGK